jgi:Tfp pilus assembly protein PilF
MALTLAVVGCNGPTTRGKQMRKEAYTRMDAVNARLVHEQAVTAFETGQLDRARTLMEEAIERYPKEAAWYVLMGRILLEQHRLDSAKRMFEHALTIDDTSSECNYYLGVVHERWSNDETAADHFSGAVEKDPDRPQYVLAAAEALIASGSLEESRVLIESRMEHFEHHAGLRHLLAQIELLSGDPESAASHCEAARLLSPNDEGIAHDLAVMRFASADWAGTLAAIDDARHRTGETAPVLQRLEARSLMAMDRSVEARDVLRQLCNRTPSEAALWRELGLLGWDVADWNSVAEAGKRLSGLGEYPCEQGLFTALFNRSRGDYQAAATELESLAERFPDRPEVWAVLAGVRSVLNDMDGSAEALELAVKWAPDHADVSAVSGVYGTQGP